MRTSKRTTVITGGAGFIGYSLCKRLLAEGDNVICVDDMSTGIQAHVDAFSGSKNYCFLHHDITEPLELECDRIFNLACPASPPAYQADPIKTLLTNVIGARNMLELAARNGARILQASTSEVYGDPLEHPQTEEYRGNVVTMGPRACYDEGKRAAETLFFDFHRTRGVDIRIARIFNTYGPGMRADDGRVISNFIVQALRGEELTMYGDGHFTRSFCFIDDMVEGLIRLMEHPGPLASPVNLGNPKEFTIDETARLILRLANSGSSVTRLKEAIDDPKHRRPSINKAHQYLDWSPKVGLDEGLQKTISYFREELQRASPKKPAETPITAIRNDLPNQNPGTGANLEQQKSGGYKRDSI